MTEIRKKRKVFLAECQKGDFPEAVGKGRELLALYRENEKTDTMEYASCLHNLGYLYDMMVLYDHAFSSYEEGAKKKKELEGESLSYANTLNNLAIVCSSMKKWKEALEYHRNILRIRKAHLGESHPDTLMSLYNMGNVYAEMKDNQKAIENLTKALKRGKNSKDFSKVDMADIVLSLARVYDDLGNYKKSMEYYEKGITFLTIGKEADSLYFVMNLLHMAATCESAGIFDKAARYCKKAIDVRKKLFPEGHMDYVTNLNHLATVYIKGEDFQKALEIHEEILQLVEGVLGKEHYFYADSINNIALDYSELGAFEKAINLNKQALEQKKELLGEHHQQYAVSIMSLGTIYERMGHFDEAIAMFQKGITLRKEVFGEESGSYVDALVAIGNAYSKKGDYKIANTYFSKSLLLRKKADMEKKAGYIWTLQCMGDNYLAEKNTCLAMAAYREAVERQKRKYGSHHPQYARALEKLGQAYWKIENYESGANVFEMALDVEKEMLGEENPRYQKTLYYFVMCQYGMGNYEKVIQYGKKRIDLSLEGTKREQETVGEMGLLLSNAYLAMQEDKTAEIYYEKAYQHLKTADALGKEVCRKLLREHGRLYGRMGDYEKAQEIFAQVGNGNALEEKNEMAKVSYLQQNFDKAQELWEEVFVGYETEHKEIALETALCLAKCLYEKKEYEQALPWAKAAREEGEGLTYGVGAYWESKILWRLGQEEEAKKQAIQAKRYFEEYEDVRHPAYGKLLEHLGEMTKKEGNIEQSISYFEGYLKLHAKGVGGKEPLFLQRLEEVATYYMDKEDKKKALEYHSQWGLLIREKEGETKSFANILKKVAKLQMELGNTADGKGVLEKVALLYGTFYGDTSVCYGKIIEKLGNMAFEEGNMQQAEILLTRAYNIWYDNKRETGFLSASKNQLMQLFREKGEKKKAFFLRFGRKID